MLVKKEGDSRWEATEHLKRKRLNTKDYEKLEDLQKPDDELDALDALDDSPEELDQLIKPINGVTYLAAWVPVTIRNKTKKSLFIASEMGEIYSAEPLRGFKSLSELPFSVNLTNEISAEQGLSGPGLKSFLKGRRPSGEEIFQEMRKAVDHFVSLPGSAEEVQRITSLPAVWCLGTFFLPAFDVVGYLWPTGERGSGKTQFLNVIAKLSFLGRVVTSSSSFASIRDEADYGATLCFDDCENIKEMENNKRELLLAGNTRGVAISIKEAIAEGQWKTRFINCFAPRAFSSIGLPDPVLGSRTISIPLIASDDAEKTCRAPSRMDDWPFNLKSLKDDCWLLALTKLSAVIAADQKAIRETTLRGRNHDVFRMPLAIAYWLKEEYGMDNVYEDIKNFSETYHSENADNQGNDLLALTLMAVDEILNQSGTDIVIKTSEELSYAINKIADREGSTEDIFNLSAQRLGRTLSGLGFSKTPGHGAKRSWQLTRKALEKQIRAGRVKLPTKVADSWLPPMEPQA